ncbi:aldo/keto reductase, partial [Lactobacillus reuteri]|nr:aldo/keto reductase [Limosilactobacillus reuteri]
LNMIPDVTPNGVFYLPPTGWLTSFYNPPDFFISQVTQIR